MPRSVIRAVMIRGLISFLPLKSDFPSSGFCSLSCAHLGDTWTRQVSRLMRLFYFYVRPFPPRCIGTLPFSWLSQVWDQGQPTPDSRPNWFLKSSHKWNALKLNLCLPILILETHSNHRSADIDFDDKIKHRLMHL